jgi:sugar phosphate isomerase/epimerase
MNAFQTDRRTLLKRAGAALAVGWTSAWASPSASLAQPKKKGRPIRLGAPVFSPPSDPEELALAHRKLGYRAAYCPAADINDQDRIRENAAGFAKHDVVIAEVGRWCNLLDADPAKRAANLKRVTEGLALAEAVGARCCVDIAGSYNTEVWYGPHPKNLSQEFSDASVENARGIIDAVKPKRAKFCYEMMIEHMQGAEEYDKSRRHLFELGPKVGVSFG